MARKPLVSNAMLALMRESEQHAWTLEHLQAALAEGNRAANFSSIFRAAEKLAAAGHIRKVIVDGGGVRFELTEAHHDHLHCTGCGELVPVPCLVGRADLARLERETGIAVRGHHLILSGFCRDCRVP